MSDLLQQVNGVLEKYVNEKKTSEQERSNLIMEIVRTFLDQRVLPMLEEKLLSSKEKLKGELSEELFYNLGQLGNDIKGHNKFRADDLKKEFELNLKKHGEAIKKDTSSFYSKSDTKFKGLFKDLSDRSYVTLADFKEEIIKELKKFKEQLDRRPLYVGGGGNAGILSIERGGTGSDNAADIRKNLGLNWVNEAVTGSINGTNKTFTLSAAPSDVNSLHLSLARQPQILTTDYTLSGNTITYVVAPDASLTGQPHQALYIR